MSILWGQPFLAAVATYIAIYGPTRAVFYFRRRSLMGLDVYLYSERKQAGEITEAQYDEHRKVPSERYPGHLFNRRYLRSSYNSGGFNSAVPDFLGEDHGLYWIFEPMGREWDGDEGTLRPADVPLLQQCKARALDVAERLRKVDPLRVDEIGNFLVQPSMRKGDFLDWYRQQKAKHEAGSGTSFDSYSCRGGTVMGFEKGMEVLAITVGLGTFGEPAALVVYRAEAIDSYIESAEITAEFCDEAISLIERDGSAYISWSG